MSTSAAVNDGSPVTTRGILLFWMPLMATWLMMSIEGPFLAAVIARLADAKENLAAYGVAFSFALMVEAPVIMLLAASTALSTDARRYAQVGRFTLVLGLARSDRYLLPLAF